jgi:argininosuccinate lyase
MKGLSLAYAKDLQEDKEPTFDSLDTLLLCGQAMAGMIGGLEVDKERMRLLAGAGYSTATDLADWLVRVGGLAFRDAYNSVAALVRLAKDRDCALEDLPLVEMQKIEPCVTESVFEVLSLDKSVASRASQGGTAQVRVREALIAAKARYL